MPLVLNDRVADTTTTTGTGTVTLSGVAPTGYQTFGAGVGNGNTTFYTISAGAEYEIGLGTYSSTGPTLSRDTVFVSSAGGTTKVNFSAGTKDVWVTYPASKAIADGFGLLPVANGGTGVTTTPSNGQLLIGNGSGYSVASLTAGSNVTITPGAGSITIAASGGGSVTISTTAPVSPSNGDLWWNSESGQPFIYYNDGTSSQWVAFALSSGNAGVSVAEARKITSLRL